MKLLVQAVLLSIIVLAGCGGGGGGGAVNVPGEQVVNGTPTPAAFSISGQMPFAEVAALPYHARLQVGMNRPQGTEVRLFDCYFESTDSVTTGEHLIYLRLSTQSGTEVVAGDSGSPVYTMEGKEVGALFAGDPADKYGFLARAAKDTTDLRPSTTVTTSSSSSTSVSIRVTSNGQTSSRSFNVFAPPLLATGMSPRLVNRLSRFDRAGIFQKLRTSTNGNQLSRAGRQQSTSSDGLKAGQSFQVARIMGPQLNIGEVGTFFHIEGNVVHALGHPLDHSGGGRALPIRLAFLDSITPSGGLFGGYKNAHPIGDAIGALTNDRNNGVVIQLGTQPKALAVWTSITTAALDLNVVAPNQITHSVALDSGSFTETMLILIALINPVDVARDQTGPGRADCFLDLQMPNQASGGIRFAINTTGTDRDLVEAIANRVSDEIDLRRRAGTSFTWASLRVSLP